MRLLKSRSNDNGFELTTFTDEIPPYAILSHTWDNGEVTYDELVAGTGRNKAGYAKIHFCVNKAAKDGLEYSWVDTCCINKVTSDELSTAINSMFRWYQRATKCYVYLSDVHVPEEITDVQAFRITWIEAFRQSRWFTRGWTLQELIAPAQVEFFSKNGKRLGSKISLEKEVCGITKIPIAALRGKPLSDFSFDERISWSANRTTTIKEDKAYCLLGIFGVFMPLIYGEGEEHALSRLKEIATMRNPQSLQPASSNVPFRRDCDFVDRSDILARINERCSRPAGRAALVGIGGFGKSQLAIEYAHRVRQQRPDTWIFWMHASNLARLEQAFSDIAERVGLYSQPSVIDTVLPVCRWLSNEANGRWLMIVDNVDNEITIESQGDGRSIPLASLLPQSDHGAVLITSRNADVARSLVGRQQDIIKIGAMSHSEAAELLRNKLVEEPSDGATELVNTLDCIPLAIVQAAAYINRLGQRMSVPKYLGQLKGVEGQVELLRKAAPDMRRDGKALNSVLATWQLSFEHIRQQRSSATDLLSFMSFFNPQSIPDFMIRHYMDNKNEEQDNSLERQTNNENDDFEEDMAVLRAFSLVDTKQREDAFEMHRLVQRATEVWLKSAKRDELWRRAFIQAMAQEFPNGEYANWSRCQTLFPHVLHMVEQKEPSMEETDTWALLMNNTGWYAWQQGLFGQAEGMVLEALRIRKQILGSDEPSTLLSSDLLGSVLKDLGKYSEAESMHRQTLATKKTAESMHRQTLATKETVLGVNHPDTLTSVYCLAHLLASRHHYDECIALYERACAGYDSTLGKDHPTTRACHQHFEQMLMSQPQDSPEVPPDIAPKSASRQGANRSGLLRKLAKLGLGRSKDNSS
ncbi:HET-domain-containing protein [Polyplosphaeria fusca]|uniref:HET-domain-containing protein n=1 Tax=Polyplosphaeria fusca TaxID=682080 RepID=A0A9P4RC81_9PLEO|nr:HET-domain-containing protein [Polyplosphaeria fusca]